MHIESQDTVHTLISDAQQFTRLYEAHLRQVLTYMSYRCDDEATAEDLTAQVFERVLKNLSTYQAVDSPFEAWLFAIARNVFTDHYRKQRLRQWLPWEKLQHKPHPQTATETLLEQRENKQSLLAALHTLKPRDRDLLALRFGAEFTNRKIAAQTGLSEQNVAVIIYRALKKLKRFLEETSPLTGTEVSNE